ncbi:SDR family NAD(P)-dependent oxidoreductase [Arenicella xantha]|uniref:NAD(P)-dependent dehydrogenase (Short-subunit alcohol dehydrogenase family) n=1 Tax=Arenicella xantha TaxID=644221 RepID=A0A395JFA5_9GAMM|nr:SDR family NAD(P)-dependent oxidoreductase [Arenicella xantha]RBP48323.1 NAD(P)-dependent dehydrogenase (short-subunit alcohol dehydrogenase family) [Arenicella xantha]
MTINFENQVAIVTGAGNGLGRSHALELAKRGAKVVINDLGGARDGTGGSSQAAKDVVATIEGFGGEALANGANVSDAEQVAQMIEETMTRWGRIDVLVNNAGILRDKTFAKMSLDDFTAVLDVHLMGSVNCTKAVWDIMREQNYGRIVMTTSSSGMYGNFGQANYGAAKMALVGLMNTLVLEGKKYGINVNTLAPTAGTRMLEDIIEDEQVMDIMSVESVTAGLITLCDKDAPNRSILCAGAGGYATTHIYETEGIYLPPEDQTPEQVRLNIDAINAADGERIYTAGFEQTNKFVEKAIAHFKSKA